MKVGFSTISNNNYSKQKNKQPNFEGVVRVDLNGIIQRSGKKASNEVHNYMLVYGDTVYENCKNGYDYNIYNLLIKENMPDANFINGLKARGILDSEIKHKPDVKIDHERDVIQQIGDALSL